MTNVQVETREEYFKAAGEREEMIRTLDALVQKAAPSFKPIIFGGMTGKWLGYGMMPYQSKSMKTPSEWPVVAIANQKNYVSLYVVYVENGEYVAEKNAKELGKVSVGKSCIRIKKLEDVNLGALAHLIEKVESQVKKGGWVFSP
jgi:hypothetical protein